MHTSGVVWFYFLLSVICGVPTLHGHIHWHPPSTYEWIFYCSQYSTTIILFLLTCFADSLPQNEKHSLSKKECPKESASFLSCLVFEWFTPLLILGWRKPLTLSDLWIVRQSFKSSNVHSIFNKYWESITGKDNRSQSQVLCQPIGDTIINGSEGDIRKYKINGNNGIERQSSLSQNSSKKPKRGVVKTIVKTFWFYFLTGSVFELVSALLVQVNPQIMK